MCGPAKTTRRDDGWRRDGRATGWRGTTEEGCGRRRTGGMTPDMKARGLVVLSAALAMAGIAVSPATATAGTCACADVIHGSAVRLQPEGVTYDPTSDHFLV